MERFSGFGGHFVSNYISPTLITSLLFVNKTLLVDISPWEGRLDIKEEEREEKDQKMHLTHYKYYINKCMKTQITKQTNAYVHTRENQYRQRIRPSHS